MPSLTGHRVVGECLSQKHFNKGEPTGGGWFSVNLLFDGNSHGGDDSLEV